MPNSSLKSSGKISSVIRNLSIIAYSDRGSKNCHAIVFFSCFFGRTRRANGRSPARVVRIAPIIRVKVSIYRHFGYFYCSLISSYRVWRSLYQTKLKLKGCPTRLELAINWLHKPASRPLRLRTPCLYLFCLDAVPLAGLEPATNGF